MIQDYEVTRKLWDGRIPVQFVLDKLEFIQCSAKPFCVSFHFSWIEIFFWDMILYQKF